MSLKKGVGYVCIGIGTQDYYWRGILRFKSRKQWVTLKKRLKVEDIALIVLKFDVYLFILIFLFLAYEVVVSKKNFPWDVLVRVKD